jgi:uncharacterized membrane protein YdjX (TVP38/TMEM64 family)
MRRQTDGRSLGKIPRLQLARRGSAGAAISGGRVNASIFLLRALPIFALSVISAAAGLLRLPLGQFTLWTFYSALPRCLFLGYLGWGLGETYQTMARGIDRAESVFSGLVVLGILAGIVWLRARVRGKILDKGLNTVMPILFFNF